MEHREILRRFPIVTHDGEQRIEGKHLDNVVHHGPSAQIGDVRRGLSIGFAQGLEAAAILAFGHAMYEHGNHQGVDRRHLAAMKVGGEEFEVFHDQDGQHIIPWDDEAFVRAMVREMRERAQAAVDANIAELT